MSDVLMISIETSELIVNDEEIHMLSKMLGDVLNSLPTKYKIDVLCNTYDRIYSKEQIQMITEIENRINLRKSQIIKANETTISNTTTKTIN